MSLLTDKRLKGKRGTWKTESKDRVEFRVTEPKPAIPVVEPSAKVTREALVEVVSRLGF